MSKEELKIQYDEYTSDYLLQLRARGDGLTDLAHTVIEEIMLERGEKLPPRPSAPVSQKHKNTNKNHALFTIILGIALFTLAALVAEVLKNTRVAFLIVLIYFAYLAYRSIRKSQLSKEEAAREQAFEKIGKDGFTELMFYASEGNFDRVQDIVNYRDEINIQDFKGGTALMYAAQNGHEKVVQFLIKSQANKGLKTSSGSTALDFAKRANHENIVRLLS